MGGASYLKSLLAPFPHLKLIPTGGVTLQTAESFLKAGARALGVGSDLVNLAAVDAGTPEVITETARAIIESAGPGATGLEVSGTQMVIHVVRQGTTSFVPLRSL